MRFSLFLFETEISSLIYHFESIKEYKGQLLFFCVLEDKRCHVIYHYLSSHSFILCICKYLRAASEISLVFFFNITSFEKAKTCLSKFDIKFLVFVYF